MHWQIPNLLLYLCQDGILGYLLSPSHLHHHWMVNILTRHATSTSFEPMGSWPITVETKQETCLGSTGLTLCYTEGNNLRIWLSSRAKVAADVLNPMEVGGLKFCSMWSLEAWGQTDKMIDVASQCKLFPFEYAWNNTHTHTQRAGLALQCHIWPLTCLDCLLAAASFWLWIISNAKPTGAASDSPASFLLSRGVSLHL